MTDTCLLIDDDVGDSLLFASALQEINSAFDCAIENSCSKALEKLHQDESFTPKLIFLDLDLPGIGGKQCITELKKIDRLRDVPIIIYSTSSEPKDVKETTRLGAAGYMVKPVGYTKLVSTLTKVLDNLSRQDYQFFFDRSA